MQQLMNSDEGREASAKIMAASLPGVHRRDRGGAAGLEMACAPLDLGYQIRPRPPGYRAATVHATTLCPAGGGYPAQATRPGYHAKLGYQAISAPGSRNPCRSSAHPARPHVLQEEVQSVLTDPEKMRQGLEQFANNPLLKGVADAVPELAEVLNNPALMEESIAQAQKMFSGGAGGM
eukprot:scaffold30120_cov56-Phaeocystis_antarctica.AAC.5